MKKYIISAISAAFLTIAAALPAHAETLEETRLAPSVAEAIPESDPLIPPERNASASESELSDGESALPDLDTPMIFQRAEQGRGDITDIISYWEENGYPEILSFISETRSEMIDGMIYTSYDVGLVPATAENCAAILDIAADNNLFRFTASSVPMWERKLYFAKLCYLAVQETDIGFLEVRFYKNSDMIEVIVSGSEKAYYERFGNQFGGVALFVNERNAVTGIDSTGFVPGDSENKIVDYVQKTANAEIFHAADLLAVYPDGWIGGVPLEYDGAPGGAPTIGIGGSGVDIGSSSILDGTVGIAAEPSAEKGVPVWLFVVGAAAVVLIAVIAVILRRRVKAAADGTAAVGGSTERELISAIKNAEEQPDPRLLEKIRDNITK